MVRVIALSLILLGLSAGGDQGQADRDALRSYREAAGLVQAGDDSFVAQMLEQAALADNENGDPPCAPRAHFLASLDREARIRGAARFAEYSAVNDAVREAASESWPEQREEILDQLRELTRFDDGDDFTAAAYAYSLRGRVNVRWAESIGYEKGGIRVERAREALEDAERALELFEACGVTRGTIEPYWVLGRAGRLLARPRLAKSSFYTMLTRSNWLTEDEGANKYRARALVGLIDLGRAAGDRRGVIRCLERLRDIGSPEFVWTLVYEYATALLHEDRAEEAIELLETLTPDEPDDREARSRLLGLCHLRLGDTDRARTLLAGVESDSKARAMEAATALAENDTERALSSASVGLGLDDDDPFTEIELRSLYGAALLRVGRGSEAVEQLQRALDLTDEVRSARYAPEDEENLIGERVGLHTVALLARALSETGRHLEAAVVAEEYQARGLRPEGTRLTSEDLVAWAASTERGLVTWVIGPDFSMTVHVDSNGNALSVPIEHGRRSVLTAVQRVRDSAVDRNVRHVASLGERVGEVLLPASIRSRLTARGTDDRVLFLLHGPLEDLPLSCLWIDGRWLNEQVVPVDLPGLPAARPGTPVSSVDDWVLLGGWTASGEGRDGLPALPFADAELDQIAELRPTARRVRESDVSLALATEVLSGDGGVHFATHISRECGHDAEWLAPLGLALAGGEVLCAHRVEEIGPRLPLVVLSACDSGGGDRVDGEGLLGLARAFLAAGTRNLLVTLWPVEDGAALRFAVEFHAALISGDPPSRAAQRARTELRRSGAPAADWAAFRLLGRD